MSSAAGTFRRAFSLIEMLVVLAIIAVVIAILLPSLSMARDQANRVRCANNLRQVGMSLGIYLTDFKDYPVISSDRDAQASPSDGGPPTPVYYSDRRSGLLALQSTAGAGRQALACPDGWASAGDNSYYYGRGLSQSGAAYMDYAYWPWRFPKPAGGFDVHYASFQYRNEKGNKILVSDIVGDMTVDSTGLSGTPSRTVGYGNHASQNAGMTVVNRSDGQGRATDYSNHIRTPGATILFADYHAQWFDVSKLRQAANGICYPPVDQW